MVYTGSMKKSQKYTIKQFQADFPDDSACMEWLVEYLYPEGIYCKIDKRITPHHQMKTRKSYSCELCGHHVHPTAGTIFHKSRTPLTLWFYAIYLISATRAGISAKQLERELGVTYKTAWRMFHLIRSMMSDDDGSNLTGEVEVDETYIGANPSRRTSAKPHKSQIVFGMVQRGGVARLRHVKSSGVRVLAPEIEKSVHNSAVIYSDEHGSYRSLTKRGYTHNSVKHSEGQYVVGEIHTQNIESVWSTMKRGIKGVYRHVGVGYLQAYVDEYAFRYSHRNDDEPMFLTLLNRVAKA